MSNLKKYIEVFLGMAYAHPDILHRPDTNPSFFSSEKKITEAFKNSPRTSDYALLLLRPFGQLEFGSQVYDNMTGIFKVLCKGGDTSEETKQQGVQDKALEIGFFIIGRLEDLYQQSPNGSPVSGFDINSVSYELASNEYGGYYGATFRFSMKRIPFNYYDSEGREAIMVAGLGDRVFGPEFGIEFE